jgi:NitT/TauT family transport system ATP-binding protein
MAQDILSIPNGSPSTGAFLNCLNVSKRFASGTLALSHVNLAVGRHEFISLLGPSGCGKSTMLRLIAGLSEPSSGTIDRSNAGHPLQGSKPRDLSFVFQEPTLMPWATVLANTMLPLDLARATKREARERAVDTLRLVGLEDFLYVYPRQLSGCMKMRVSIARALVTQPQFLLLDEPFAALDELTRFKLNNDLLKLWAEANFTIIFVTHSIFESVYLSQRVVVMSERPGQIIAEIPIDVAYPRIADFRLSAQYNAYCAEVSRALEQRAAALGGAA